MRDPLRIILAFFPCMSSDEFYSVNNDVVNHNYAILMDLHVLQAQTNNREIIFLTTLCKVSFYNVYFKGRLKN